MKILLVATLLLSFHAEAQDAVECATKASNFSLYIKMKSFITQRISDVAQAQNTTGEIPPDYNPYADPKVTVETVCSGGDSSFFEETIKSKKLIIKRIADDVRAKGKVSQNAFNGINAFADKDMTQKEVCDSIKKISHDEMFGNGYTNPNCKENDEEIYKAANSAEILSKNFNETCLAMFPQIKKFKSRERTCDDEEIKIVENVELKNEAKNTPKSDQRNLPGVEEKKIRYLKPTGASAQ